MSRGKRYETEPKLNYQKVIAVIIALAVIVMFVLIIRNIFNEKEKISQSSEYFVLYSNEKWGVINQLGETVIAPSYREMLVIPDKTKEVFLCTYDINEETGEYKTKAINSKNEEILTGYDKIEAIDNIDKNENVWYEDNVLRVQKDGKYGLIDLNGKELLPTEYDEIIGLNGIENSILIKKDDKYGLVNDTGSVIIEPNYKEIKNLGETYREGYITIDENDKYGVINSDYTIICEPQYSTIEPIGNEFWKVSIVTFQTYDNKNEVYGILDSYGKERLEPIYQFIGDVDDNRIAKGRAIINRNGLLGLVDENYCILAEPQYGHISEFKNGKASVSKRISKKNMSRVDIVHGEIDINGVFTDISEIIKTDVHSISNADETNSNVKTIKTLENGYVVIQKDDSSPIYQYCAVLDKDNNIILPYKYHNIEQLDNGMYLVENRGRYGLLNHDFKEVIIPQYTYLQQIQNVFLASTDSNFYSSKKNVGLIDLYGNIILKFDYSAIESAVSGLVWIHKEKRIGLATTEGKVLFAPQYGKVEPFINGFAKVNNGYWYEYDEDYGRHSVRTVTEYSEGKWGLINSEGILILPAIYDSISILGDDSIKVSKQIGRNHIVTGLANKEGELLIRDSKGNYILASQKYDWQEDFNAEGYSQVYYKGCVGIVNRKNQQIISCQIDGKPSEFILPEEYDWGYNSTSQFVIIEMNDKKGIIDCANNNIVIKPVFDKIDALSDNTSFVFKCGIQNENHNNYRPSYTWSIINVDGKAIIDIQSEEIIHLGFSLLAIKTNNNKYSIVDFNGQSTSKITFDAVFCFGIASNVSTSYSWETPKNVDGLNYSIVGLDGKYGIIDNQGKLVIHPKYSTLSIQKNGQFLADGILINAFEQKIAVRDNSVLIMPGDYDKIEILENGILLVSKNELFGCINQIGTVIIPLKYRKLTYQNNLLIAVCYDDTDETYKLGVLDLQENQIVPFCQQIDEIKIESEIILYKQDRHWGAYTLQGQVICEPIYDHIVYVTHNLIKVGIDVKDYESYNNYYWEAGERYDFTNYNKYSIINWGLITYDQFQSQESMQELDKAGFPVDYQSVDKTDEAYLLLVDYLYEEKVKMPYNDEFERNLANDHFMVFKNQFCSFSFFFVLIFFFILFGRRSLRFLIL